MNIFVKRRSQRESIVSSSSSFSKESVDSNQTKQKCFCFERLLFFGPLILFVTLLITGTIVFVIIHHHISQHENDDLYSDEDYVPLSCPFGKWKNPSAFARSQLKCGFNSSSIFHIHYSNSLVSMKAGENLTEEDVINTPKIKLNRGFLSKIPTKSFVLIFVSPITINLFDYVVALQWIRYYSSSLDEEEDICYDKPVKDFQNAYYESIFLLYATNFSRMMLRAETVCDRPTNFFKLDEYINLTELTLIASTNFFTIRQ